MELCERFTFYGCQGLFQNYVQRPLDGSLGRGALGQGHMSATALTTFFSLWCYGKFFLDGEPYSPKLSQPVIISCLECDDNAIHTPGPVANNLIVTPIFGAIVADQYLGRYRTIVLFGLVYTIGLLILFLTSLPIALQNGAGMGGFIAAILIIGIGTGGIKSNVSPLIADQYERKRMAIQTLKTGERIILDPAVTIQRIYMVFYVCINVGSLSLLATPYMERDVGFWSACTLPHI